MQLQYFLFRKLGSFQLLQDVLKHLHTQLFCPSFSNLSNIFGHIFFIPRSSLMIHQTISLFVLSSSAIILTVRSNNLTVAPHFFPQSLNIFICFTCGWPPTPGIIFHIFSSLYESTVPLKKLVFDIVSPPWAS